MKAATAGANSRIRVAAGSPARAISEGSSENGGRSVGTEEPVPQDPRVARRDGADNTITVYGPRRSDDGDEVGVKVKATRGQCVADRLLVTFHNLDLKGKGKDKDNGKTSETNKDDEACEMGVDG